MLLSDNALLHLPCGDFRDASMDINHHAWECHHKHFRYAQKSLSEKKLAVSVAVKGKPAARLCIYTVMSTWISNFKGGYHRYVI